jgi:glycosyltransferase involved in cell wall biosynthesis
MLRIAQAYERKYPESRHHFIFNIPYSNRLLGMLRKRWKEYHELIKNESFELEKYRVNVIGIPGFASDIKIRGFLANFGYKIFRKRIESIVKSSRPDVIHAHDMRSNIEIAELLKQKFGIGYIVSARNVHENILNRIVKGELNPSSIIAHSYVSASRCDGCFKPVYLIPHPVDHQFFKDIIETNSEKNDVLRIVSICSLIKLKNIDKVIHALNGTGLNFHYTIFGDGPEKRNLEELCRSYGLREKIQFLGFVPYEEISNSLGQYDLMVMPSYPETLGRVYFEAMAAGIPVVAARNAGVDEMIRHQVQGYLVSHNNVNEIQEAIRHFANLSVEDKMVMKSNASLFAKQFNWDAILEMYNEVYNSLILDRNLK